MGSNTATRNSTDTPNYDDLIDAMVAELDTALAEVRRRSRAYAAAGLTQSPDAIINVVIPDGRVYLREDRVRGRAEQIAKMGGKTNMRLVIETPEQRVSCSGRLDTSLIPDHVAPDDPARLLPWDLDAFGGSSAIRQYVAVPNVWPRYRHTGSSPIRNVPEPRIAAEPADGRMVLYTDPRGVHTAVLIRSDRDAVAGDYPLGQCWFEIDPDSVADPVTYGQLVDRTVERGGTLQLLSTVKVLVAPAVAPAR